jgi:hypothetical protein
MSKEVLRPAEQKGSVIPLFIYFSLHVVFQVNLMDILFDHSLLRFRTAFIHLNLRFKMFLKVYWHFIKTTEPLILWFFCVLIFNLSLPKIWFFSLHLLSWLIAATLDMWIHNLQAAFNWSHSLLGCLVIFFYWFILEAVSSIDVLGSRNWWLSYSMSIHSGFLLQRRSAWWQITLLNHAYDFLLVLSTDALIGHVASASNFKYLDLPAALPLKLVL